MVRPGARAEGSQRELLDEMLAESFPASDPPTWDTAAERIEALEAPGAP